MGWVICSPHKFFTNVIYIVKFYMQDKEATIEWCEFQNCGLSDESIYTMGFSFLFIMEWWFLSAGYTHLRSPLQFY